jgi:putative transcriptional regulator
METKIVFRGRVVVSVPRDIDVVALRHRLGMSQNLFAARFGFPLATLRHWEYGRRKPSGASLALLNVINANPGVVLRALRAPALEVPVAIAEDPRALAQAPYPDAVDDFERDKRLGYPQPRKPRARR